MTSAKPGSPNSSAYSTGGGGTRLEHRYGAVLLAALLTGDPLAELGDDVAARSVRFQASAISPVDDLVVESGDNNGLRRVSIGVRRAPKLTKSDEDSVPLLQSYLRVVLEHRDEVESGRWRLTLAVSGPNPAVRQVKELAVVALASPDADDFRTQVAQPGAVNDPARTRLTHLDALVAAAAADLDTDVSAEELTWRLLSVLRIRELRLEGADEGDRTEAVKSLRSVVADGSPGSADALFARLVELTGRYAPSGARVTELTLRRDLAGSPLRRSPSHAQAWTLLDSLDRRLRQWTPAALREGDTTLELDRAEARTALTQAMTTAGAGGVLIVTGEPDVGKSVLTLRAAEQLAGEGAVVVAMSLRDLPSTPLELETHLGAALGDVLATTATGEVRLLVLDGAELALAGGGPLLEDISGAALRTGLGVVAVTRNDGARRVLEILAEAARAAGANPPQEHVVLPLTDAEGDLLTGTFAALTGLRREERSRWLLGRPGLVDLLLKSGVVLAPANVLSEADVFAAVWDGLVRNSEQIPPGGPTPDQRDVAMTAVARRELLPGGHAPKPDPVALPALRSDGLLKSGELPAAWRANEEFAGDLIRDFALSRLLLTDGWQVLIDAEAPRWAIRAVRLACQVRLRTRPDATAAWRDLESVFEEVARRFGQRWSEVPLEALLALGDAHSTLSEVWPLLSSDDGARAKTIVRLGLQRYTTYGFGDHAILAPLVALAFEGAAGFETGRRTRGDDDQLGKLALAWLRGLAQSGVEASPLRRHVRDAILAASPNTYDEFAVEAIATLGPDLDAAAEAFLRRVATEHSYHLWPAVESTGPVIAMVKHRPELMLDLAEAYYIDRPERTAFAYLDDGIRRHRGEPIRPQTAWYYGPFWQLIHRVPIATLALINRMLDHAAEVRVRGTDDPPTGIELTLPELGSRSYIGDGHVWAWYRGSSVGPYACMSALLAVERFADHLVDTLSIPLSDVVGLLLRDCHNLAMPGLVVGLLVRHLEHAADLLDPWLVHSEVWELEISRAGHEGLFHVQGRDDAGTAGLERRSFSLRDVVAQMTLRAALTGDATRLARLAELGDDLFSHARELLGDAEEAPEELARIEAWRAAFHPENYRAERTEDGMVLQYEHPEPVAAQLAPTLAELSLNSDALRLGNTYAASDDRTAPTDTLIEDIALARRLTVSPPPGGPLFGEDPVAAVAAAAVVAFAHGQVDVPEEDLHWAVDTLLEAAMASRQDSTDYAGTVSFRGADRSAAAALPLALMPPFDATDLDPMRVEPGLQKCATSLFDEVRTIFAVASQPVWTAPCNASARNACRHLRLWNAILAGLADARLGECDERGLRTPDTISPPYPPALSAAPAEDLLVNRLVPPLAAAAAARTTACIASEAEDLLDVLLEAHRRGSDHWAREGYSGYEDRQRQVIARVLVTLTIDGVTEPLIEHVRRFAHNANALHALLDDLATLFTYEDALRPHIGEVWRHAMTAALDAIDAGAGLLNDDHWVDWAVAALLPTPHLNAGDTDPDATLRRARDAWVSPESISDLVVRWLPLAHWEPKAADAIASLAKCGPMPWQFTTALDWVEQVVDGRYDIFANRSWFLTDWLGLLREAGLGVPEGTTRWRRLVDGLAAASDRQAVELQRLEE